MTITLDDTMSERDSNDLNYRVASRLECWSRYWELKPDWLICRECGQVQTFHSAARAFSGHKPGCRTPAASVQYPLLELADLLRELPADPTAPKVSR
ncbi:MULTISPECIES: hypothetical protein [Pseudomonas]|uniref:hypothetical protein n=1 Tax=Pseudomonas TaxID=286 RepID=UPI0012497255|nr:MULTISPECIES: hypothetical protein [Pseudomonas]CAG8866728.1 hypothetical protein PS861_01640 [Pseudomonas fluorescens]